MRRVSTPALLYCCSLAVAVLAAAAGCGGSSDTPTPGTGGSNATAGTTGSAGTSGSAGTTGNAGTSGPAGTSGSAGTTGAAGSISTAGTTGSAGNGSSGAAGGARRHDRERGARRHDGQRRRERLDRQRRLRQLHVHAVVGDQHDDHVGRHDHLVDHALRRDVGEDRLRPDDLVRHERAGRLGDVEQQDDAARHEVREDVPLPDHGDERLGLVPERRLHPDDGRASDRVAEADGHDDERVRPLRRLPGHRPVHDERRVAAHRRTSSTPTAITSGLSPRPTT